MPRNFLLLRCAALVGVLVAIAVPAVSQNDAAPIRVLPAPPALLQGFDVSLGTVQELSVPQAAGGTVRLDVVLAGAQVQLDLWLNDVRAPGFRLMENTGTGLRQLPTPPCVTYRGVVTGEPGSVVAATLDAGSLTAYIARQGGDVWVVQPVRAVDPRAGAAAHVVFRGADTAPLPYHCGVTAVAPPLPPQAGIDVVWVCDLALECDFPLFQLNGSNTTATQNDATGIVNAINVIYQRDVDIRFSVSQMIVDTSADPYTTTDPGTLLNQFGSFWNINRGGVQRDVAHLLTGRNIAATSGGVIGVALLGTICNTGNAYGLSQSHFTTNFSARTSVTAHELGHSFGASHCNGAGDCGIMCSGIGGCPGSIVVFGVGEQNQIVAFRNTRPCLAQQATTPVISNVSPIQATTFDPPLLVVTGSGMTGVNQAAVDATPVTGAIQVVNDSEVRFVPPEGLGLGIHAVTVTNPAGTSNQGAVIYIGRNPCVVRVPIGVFGGTNMTWDMGGWPGDFTFLLVSLFPGTSPLQGLPVLGSFSVVFTGVLDGRGMASFAFPVPAGVLSGLRVYSQMLSVPPGTLNLRSVSTVPSTLVVG